MSHAPYSLHRGPTHTGTQVAVLQHQPVELALSTAEDAPALGALSGHLDAAMLVLGAASARRPATEDRIHGIEDQVDSLPGGQVTLSARECSSYRTTGASGGSRRSSSHTHMRFPLLRSRLDAKLRNEAMTSS